MLFKQFDVDNSNLITPKNVKDALKKLGKTISQEDLVNAFDEHDTRKDGTICFQEFKEMMIGDNEF